jgi:hypothetical protein
MNCRLRTAQRRASPAPRSTKGLDIATHSFDRTRGSVSGACLGWDSFGKGIPPQRYQAGNETHYFMVPNSPMMLGVVADPLLPAAFRVESKNRRIE